MEKNKITVDIIKKRIKENLRRTRKATSFNHNNQSEIEEMYEIPIYTHSELTNKFSRWLFKVGTRYADNIKSIPIVSGFADSFYWKLTKEKNNLSIRLDDILKYENRAFITVVYKTILRRNPDPERMNFYINAYKTLEKNKVEIINDILTSPEGKAKGIKVLGLRKALFIVKLKKSIKGIPLLGRLAQLVYTTWNISDYIVILQKQATISRIEIEDIQSRLASIDDIYSKINDINTQLSSIGDLSNQVQSIQFRLGSIDDIFSQINDINSQLSSISDLSNQIQGITNKLTMIDSLKNQVENYNHELQQLGHLYHDLNRNHINYRQEVAYLSRKLHLINNELKDIYAIGKDEAGKKIAKIDVDSYKYSAFENLYRGSRNEIKERQRQYVNYIRKAYEESQGDYLLDVGCGRGEFLELLKEINIPAAGIDINDAMIEKCRKYGLNVKESDILEFLNRLSDDALTGITAFQVIEHLSVDYLSEFINLSFQKIKHGGIIILETINPSTFIAMKPFWMDLSHVRPIPSETLSFLTEYAGFRDISIKFSSQVPDKFRLKGTDENIKILNEILFGYQNYAVIGWK